MGSIDYMASTAQRRHPVKARRMDIRAEQAACPRVAEHANGPSGYVQWHEWAADRAKTHVCRKCPGCGYWMIWETK